MKQSVHRLLAALFTLTVAAPILAQAQAQTPSQQSSTCGPDDSQCLTDNMLVVCAERNATIESCLGWLRREVEVSAFTNNPAWRLVAGQGYSLAADLSRSSDDAESLRQRSRSIFGDLIAGAPDSEYAVEAYLGLATIAPDVHERISFLRNAVRTGPGNATKMTFLADALLQRGAPGDSKEAADLYRGAYIASGDRKVWAFASKAVRLYSSISLDNEAAALKARVAHDSGMAELVGEVTTEPSSQDVGRAEIIAIACDRFIVAIFGRDTCASAVTSLTAATRSVGVPMSERQALVNVAVEGMRLLRIADDLLSGATDDPAQRYFDLRIILAEWIETGVATADAYALFAQLPSAFDSSLDDLDESVAAFERAVELAPDNSQYRYWLALGYIEQKRFSEAVEHLNVVRDSVTANAGPSREAVDNQLRIAETAMRRVRQDQR